MNPNRIDRRRFLIGSGATLALPMLESLAPRTAFGQSAAAAPKRLILMHTQDGRLIGDGDRANDWWSPLAATGALTASMSPMLSPLASVRNELVTLDGIDNLVRHTVSDGEGHLPAQKTCLTCRTPNASGDVIAPSFDYLLGTRLAANASMRPSVVLSGTAADYTWRAGNSEVFFGEGGSPPTLISFDPAAAIGELFGPPMVQGTPPPPTLADRMKGSRKSVLDGVLSSFNALRGRVSAADKAKLDAHANFIRTLEQRNGSTPVTPSMSCQRPAEASVPSNDAPNGGAYLRGEQDAAMMPVIVENLVQTIACDVTRVASLFFWNADDPIFPTEFSGTSPFQQNNWHATIHGVPRPSENMSDAQALTNSFHFYAKAYAQIVTRLSQITDVDGSRLLDNTLVLWVSEMGRGAVHVDYDIPVVMAGLKSGFPKGQGRHVVSDRRSLGDLYAQVLRMYGGSDTTFGETGTIGDHNPSGDMITDAGYPGLIARSTPLHLGAIDL
ncbi:MAG: DUF1552 domain-containing protein [Myxococcaceae bacterium]